VTDRAWQHPWLRIQRLIRSILEVRRDPVTRPGDEDHVDEGTPRAREDPTGRMVELI